MFLRDLILLFKNKESKLKSKTVELNSGLTVASFSFEQSQIVHIQPSELGTKVC